MTITLALQKIQPLYLVFLFAAAVELWRERSQRLYFGRFLALSVSVVTLVLLFVGADGHLVVPVGAGLGEQLNRREVQGSALISSIPFSGTHLFALVSVGVFLAGVVFAPAAPIVRVRMSRVFAMQAVLFGLIYVQSVEWFLLLGILLAIGCILSVRFHWKSMPDDEQRLARTRAFTVYQSAAVCCMGVSLLLRLLLNVGLLIASPTLWTIDVVSLCLASAILLGLFPFHGWVLPFLGSPRATIFLPMFCIQTGLIFFFRIYAPIVSSYDEYVLFFAGVPVVGILYAALLFFGETRLKRIPGNLYLSHICLMAISVVGFGSTTMTAAVLDGVNTVVATVGLLGVCALLTSRFGIRGVLVPTGLGSFFPEIAVCYLICVLSLVGFPGTLGFIEEEVLLGQAIGHHNLLVAVIAIALTLNGFSSFRLFARVFMGQPVLGQDSETALSTRERFIIYVILAVIVVNGLAPSFILDSLTVIAH